MIQYIFNTETEKILYNEAGNWGPIYVESGGEWGSDPVFRSPWRAATQVEIDAELLTEAKDAKLGELANDFTAYECGGYDYGGNIYCLKQVGIDNIVTVVDGLDAADPNAYTFRDIDSVPHDFETQEGWNAFKQAMQTERNRIMVYYIAKKVEINACSTVAEVEAVVIDFSPT